MAKSLQDQLLQAGLADDKKVRQVRQEKRKARKQNKPVDADAEARRKQAEQAKAEKVARDREINRQRQEQQARQAKQAQVRQLVEHHAVSRSKGETAYQFVVGKKVHKIYVGAEQADQLARGRLAIVALGEDFHIIPAEAAGKIRERDSEIPIIQHDPKADQPDEDDPYKDYQIPDDLMW
ncbi:DUF2058 family protein [Marinobacter nanhaiticus D15-8W]|uniref:DUF2058 domain-containing protein n=1 Tax=Marinobacter nanhaiticus D15-8W TaxID=626887 RepID=N6WUG4_9GAMM|nr:DUF2058 domain-containing protein [Marinobacter nanhaiticus]ENO15176.1 DUF2058 domain-containing protein [Marinobacter nanhaiticus D15-8W]BES69122.1 DUF2058 family protein [Marinobacter nanhaiticus D15-8W]